MLYNVVIDQDTAANRDKLVESLYTFLYRYTPTRLVYESEHDIEDAIQDTLLFILKRYDELIKDLDLIHENWVNNFNFEKYFFNRARSYLSYWLRKKKRDRDNEREYIENAIYLQKHISEPINDKLIDYNILTKVSTEYNFNETDTEMLSALAERMLGRLGYAIEEGRLHFYETYDSYRLDVLYKIAYSVVDEYLIIVLGER